LPERILAIKSMTVEKTAPDQSEWIREFIDEYDTILGTIGSTVIAAVESALKDIRTAGESN
jgi:hypothetical protein